MFTGIIQVTGRLARREPRGAGARLTIAAARPLARLALGESIAVNGACLTVVARRSTRFTVDVSPETLRRTTLGALVSGARVNLERALRIGDRLGGHFVQGHVDGVGRLRTIRPDADWQLYEFEAPRSLARYLVESGPRLTAAFFAGSLVDRLVIFQSSLVLGDRAPRAFKLAPRGFESSLMGRRIIDQRRFGPDSMTVYAFRDVPCSPD